MSILKKSYKDILKSIDCALELLYKNDSFLLQNISNNNNSKQYRLANERSISHKFAEYLQNQFPSWNVDCEYNRHEYLIKKINGIVKVFPDIIVHHRGVKENLVVIELKTSNENNLKDLIKLKYFTNKSNEYGYVLGLFIKLRKEGVDEYRYIVKGEEVEVDGILNADF